MAPKSKSGNQIYFTKDHEMVRRAVRDFVKKEINPHMDEWEEKGEAPFWGFAMIPNTVARAWTTGMIWFFWKSLDMFTALESPWRSPSKPIWQHRRSMNTAVNILKKPI
jgi:hypothetical protein